MKRLRVVGAALLVVGIGCVDRLVGSDPPLTPSAVFDLVWSDFDRNYAMFGVKRVDWDAVRATYQPQAAAARTVADVAPIIGAMFRELHDLHVNLFLPSGKIYSSVESVAPTYFNPPAILSNYVPSSTMTPSRSIRYGKLAPDIGWIWVASFAGKDLASEVDAAIDALGGVAGIVIDVRNNGGGSTNNSAPIAGRFIDERRIFSYVRYRNGPAHDDLAEMRALETEPSRRFAGRVVVLINRRCASATESFALSMKSQPGVILVGDTTAGAMGNPMMRELANGWTYRLPQWVQYDADKTLMEDLGVIPHVVVKMTSADSAAGKDPQLERALALARQP